MKFMRCAAVLLVTFATAACGADQPESPVPEAVTPAVAEASTAPPSTAGAGSAATRSPRSTG